jgi:hypothetical protein
MIHGSMRPRSATAPTARATLYKNEMLIADLIGLPSRVEVKNSRNRSEHALEDSEQEIGDLATSD